MTYPTDRPATWFVTGTSRGLGRSLVIELLSRGGRVAATTRSTERLLGALDGVDTTNLLPLEVQLTDEADVARAVEATVARFGGIDVVVNNAGYGYLAAVEETTDADVRAMFDVQVNGTWNVLRAVLPTMRAARSGHVITISSILGLLSFPGWGLYCAAKFAVEGLTEALAAEVAEHGIATTIVEPGYFDTDFLTSDSLALPSTTTDAYPAIREMVEAHLAMPGSQPGDPARAAAAIAAIAERGVGPLHQQLGSDSSQLAASKAEALAADIAAGRELAVSTDYVR
jgi:NAD(P)-dependent dehydrogenase (short-subunit alcohol dehydrogenase family)